MKSTAGSPQTTQDSSMPKKVARDGDKPQESEAEFQRVVIRYAKLRSWRVAHFRPAQSQKGNWITPMIGDPGWVDLVLLRPPRLVLAELKSDRGAIRPNQKVWLEQLTLVPGVEVYLWRPRNWNAIETTLR